MVIIFIWFAWYMSQLPIKTTRASQMDCPVNLLCSTLGEAAVNEVFCLRFKSNFSFFYKYIFSCMGMAHQLATTGSISYATTSYWVRNLQVTCCTNYSKVSLHFRKSLKFCRHIHFRNMHFWVMQYLDF